VQLSSAFFPIRHLLPVSQFPFYQLLSTPLLSPCPFSKSGEDNFFMENRSRIGYNIC
jgi:hypothetical protein